MNIPFFSKADADECRDEQAQQRKQRKAEKKRRREEAVAKDVLAWSSEVLAPGLSQPPTKKSAEAVTGDESTPGTRAGSAANTTTAEATTRPPAIAEAVPLTLHLSGLPAVAKKCHVEAWVLQAQGIEVSDIVELRLVPKEGASSSSSSSGHQAHRGFGFVELRNEATAQRVLALDGEDLLGGAVRVQAATPKPSRNSGSKQGKMGGERPFGALDMAGVALSVDARHKKLVQEQIERNDAARAAYLAKQAAKKEAEAAHVAAGGTLPGGLGFGYAKGRSAGTPKLHGGYASFDV